MGNSGSSPPWGRRYALASITGFGHISAYSHKFLRKSGCSRGIAKYSKIRSNMFLVSTQRHTVSKILDLSAYHYMSI